MSFKGGSTSNLRKHIALKHPAININDNTTPMGVGKASAASSVPSSSADIAVSEMGTDSSSAAVPTSASSKNNF